MKRRLLTGATAFTLAFSSIPNVQAEEDMEKAWKDLEEIRKEKKEIKGEIREAKETMDRERKKWSRSASRSINPTKKYFPPSKR